MAKAKKPVSSDKTTAQTSKATKQADAEAATKPATSPTSAARAAVDKTTSDKTPIQAPMDAKAATSEKPAAEASAEKPSLTTAIPAVKKPDAPAKGATDKTDAAKGPSPETAKPAESAAPASKAAGSDKGEPKPAAPAPLAAKADQAKPESATATKADPEPQSRPETTKGEAKPELTPRPAPAPVQPERGPVFWPLVLGGVAAGIIGFIASEANLMGTRGANDDLTNIRSTVDAQQAAIAALEAAEPVAAPSGEMPDLSGIQADIAKLAEDLTGLNATVAALDTRIAAVEARPISDGSAAGEAAAAYAAELAALKTSVEAQKSEIATLLANARTVEEATADAARAAAAQSALAQVTASLSTGTSYAAQIDDLAAAGIADLPEALILPADEGVATLANLQSRFPDVARAALADARAAGSDGSEPGLGGFLRRQLGARSVTPRDGSDPDAVLSRAEAAVRDGRIADALIEIDMLPAETQATMQSWIADARARAAAEAAAQSLSQRLTAN